MAIFTTLTNTLTGQVSASERKLYITLHGFNGHALVDEIYKIWRTSRIENQVFNDIGRFSVTFHKFFLLDIIYTLETIVKQPYTSLSRRSVLKAIDALKDLTDLRIVFDGTQVNSIVDKSTYKLFKKTPQTWQDEYLDIYSDRIQRYKLTGHLLDAKPGTGKTLGSLFLMEALKCDTIIVVAPKAVIIDAWKNTIEEEYKQVPHYWHSIMPGGPTLNNHLYVLHYEYLPKFMDFINSQNRSSFGKVGLVLDECHNFNEENSNRTQALIELTRKNVNYSLWMSGTPIKKLGKEIIPLESCIDPLFDEDCRKRFIGVFGRSSDRALDILANRIGIISHTVQSTNVITDIKLNTYTANVTLQNGQEYTIPSIREKMKKYIEERSKFYKANMDSFIQDFRDAIQYYQETIRHKPQEKEALNTYLQYIEEIRRGYDPVAMKEQAMYCNRFEKTKIIPVLPKELKDPFRKAKSVYKYVQLTIMGECLGVILGKSRIDCNIDLALNLGNMKLIPEGNASPLGEMSLADVINNATKKTIIFSSFVEVVTNLKTQLIQQGFNPLVVYGDTNKDLPKIIDAFDRDDTSNPLIATFQSLSTGVRLTMANTIIMLNSPYRDHEYKQAVARAFRKGQNTDVNVINVLLDTGGVPNISTRSKDIADEAANIVALIMGIKKVDLDTLSNESFLEEQLDMVYRLSDQDKVSLENCATCSNAGVLPYSTSQGSIPVNSNHGTGVETATKNTKGFDPESNLQQANTRDISSEREVPYYKTDKGNTIEEVMKLTEDDPMWDHIDKGNVLLKDKPKEDEGLTSFMTGVNQSYGW